MLREDIGAYLLFLAQSGAKSQATVSAYRADLEKLALFAGDVGVSRVQEMDAVFLSDFLLDLRNRGASAGGIRRETACLHGFFAFLVKKGYLHRDPSAGLSGAERAAGAAEKKAPEPLTTAELDALYAAPEGEGSIAKRDRAILMVLGTTGIRTGELVQLQVRDIDFLLDALDIKGEAARKVPFPQRTEEALSSYIASAREEFPSRESPLFPGKGAAGEPISRQGVWKLVLKYGRKAGIAGNVTPARLRAAFAESLQEQGVPKERIRRLLGKKCGE